MCLHIVKKYSLHISRLFTPKNINLVVSNLEILYNLQYE